MMMMFVATYFDEDRRGIVTCLVPCACYMPKNNLMALGTIRS